MNFLRADRLAADEEDHTQHDGDHENERDDRDDQRLLLAVIRLFIALTRAALGAVALIIYGVVVVVGHLVAVFRIGGSKDIGAVPGIGRDKLAFFIHRKIGVFGVDRYAALGTKSCVIVQLG